MITSFDSWELWHYGIPGMKRGVRRFQDTNGNYTAAGLSRYGLNNGGYQQARSSNSQAVVQRTPQVVSQQSASKQIPATVNNAARRQNLVAASLRENRMTQVRTYNNANQAVMAKSNSNNPNAVVQTKEESQQRDEQKKSNQSLNAQPMMAKSNSNNPNAVVQSKEKPQENDEQKKPIQLFDTQPTMAKSNSNNARATGKTSAKSNSNKSASSKERSSNSSSKSSSQKTSSANVSNSKPSMARSSNHTGRQSRPVSIAGPGGQSTTASASYEQLFNQQKNRTKKKRPAYMKI